MAGSAKVTTTATIDRAEQVSNKVLLIEIGTRHNISAEENQRRDSIFHTPVDGRLARPQSRPGASTVGCYPSDCYSDANQSVQKWTHCCQMAMCFANIVDVRREVFVFTYFIRLLVRR